MLPIFMDNHSTTPVDPRVLEEMLPYFTKQFGNAASRNHAFGQEAEKGVDRARGQIAHLIHCDPSEIIFTSGGTESNNIALKGIASDREKGYPSQGSGHIITCVTEHKSVLDTAKRLEKIGVEVTYLPVDSDGLVNPADVASAITPRTILISIMMANNEIGTIQPIAEIGKIAKEAGIFFHSDTTQAVGKVPVDVTAMGIDLLSLSAHKMYGPKGIGALYVRRKGPKVNLAPLFDGGGHERGMRAGTLNVPGIVGLGKACEICEQEMREESARLEQMREKLKKTLFEGLSEIVFNGHPTKRLPNNLNLSFAFVEGESLLLDMPEIALSSGSACTTGSMEPSHVLRALGISNEMAHCAIRIGLGRFNTAEEVEYAGGRIIASVNKLRKLSPLYKREKRETLRPQMVYNESVEETMETTANLITLTNGAVTEIKAMMKEKHLDNAFLRVGVKAGGCSGMTYQLTFEKETNPTDLSFEVEGVRVAVDEKSAPYLTGMTLDFSKNLVGGGFKFINPNAKRSCGCGESFAT